MAESLSIRLSNASGDVSVLAVQRHPSPALVAHWLNVWSEYACEAGVSRGPTEAWDWAAKALRFSAPMGVTIALTQTHCEGLMSLSWPFRSLIDPQREVLYLEYVEAAPWNRGDLALAKKISGLGTILLYLAVEESFDAGHRGGVALHSLRTSEPFYRRVGMTEVGSEDCGSEGRLTRFEFTPADAEAFRRKMLRAQE